MKNKKTFFKVVVLSLIVGCFSISLSSASTLHLNLDEGIQSVNEQAILDKMMPVHFADNGNDFGGFLYLSNMEDTGNIVTNPSSLHSVGISGSSIGYQCSVQLKGFYYNAERGERLWPLDEDTAEKWRNTNEIMSGGIYTACGLSGYINKLLGCQNDPQKDYNECVENIRKDYDADGNGYYGDVTHTYSGKVMHLIVGVKYGYNALKPNRFIYITGSDFSPTFKRIDNKYPVGFIYDYNGGLGLAGCHFLTVTGGSMRSLVRELNSTGIDNMFEENNDPSIDAKLRYKGSRQSGNIECSVVSAEDTMNKVVIEGIVGMSEAGNEGGAIFGYIGNQSDTKMQYFTTANVNNSTIMNYARKKAEILCRGKWSSDFGFMANRGKIVCLKDVSVGSGLADAIKNANKTLIVKNGNVTIKPMTGKNSTEYYDMFIDGGNLFIEEDDSGIESGDNEELFIFTKEGFISDDPYSGFNDAITSDIQNGEYTGQNIAVGAFIRGNIIVNGKVKGVGGNTLKHKYFIYGKFTTQDGFTDLENIFSWRCNNQISNEVYKFYCPKGNPYANASLVVIDQNHPSTFFNNN